MCVVDGDGWFRDDGDVNLVFTNSCALDECRSMWVPIGVEKEICVIKVRSCGCHGMTAAHGKQIANCGRGPSKPL